MSSGTAPRNGSGQAFDNQHVVSRAVLRQWIDGEPRLLEIYDRESGLIDLAPTDEVCAIEKFIHDDPARAEQTWGRYETHLGDFYRALSENRLFDDPRGLKTARTTLALHAARSYTMRDVSLRAQPLVREIVSHDLVADYFDELIAEIHNRSFLVAPITYAVLLDEARRAVDQHLGAPGDADFRNRLFGHFRRARQLMEAQAGLEVFVPANPQSEFVIGDDPVLLPSTQEDGRVGLRDGVRWLEAQTFVMPFSPRHVIAVGPANVWREVNDDVVRWINLHQLRQSRRHLVTRRGSGLADWAADVIRTTTESAV
jgi:hypothetical protein